MKAKEHSSCIQTILEKLTYNSLKDIDGLIKEIKKFYTDNERHKYSDITLHLFNLQHAEQNGKIENMEKNIKLLIENLNLEDDKKLKDKLFKLQDHVLLEIARLYEFNIIKKDIEKTSKEVQESKKDIEKTSKEVQESKKDIEKTSKEVQESKKSYIAILGIFSSIILSFVAGLNFSNSILSNIDKASIYRLVFVMAFITLFVGNILYFLFAFLLKISLNIHFQTNRLLIIFNIIILAIMSIDFMCYLFNIKTIDDILAMIDFLKQKLGEKSN
ncbi:TPA: hypothetical protein R2A47_001641 [Campylobacter jejuni]|uniref:Uncharacterized protein n=1 Tax=Campylobacter jejuni TaxID=197 RepID=A0AB36G0Z4_CAMJU|nr:hypothetical protein AJY60_10665 [Campylobacter jejuni]HEC2405903.1 hypothetical protein [Campylobacter jejuni]HEC2421724.1 hypothetical protein [Campylobacter jejuni]